MSKVTEIFGSKVFNDETMKERLPKDAYKALRNTVEEGRPLDRDLANQKACPYPRLCHI